MLRGAKGNEKATIVAERRKEKTQKNTKRRNAETQNAEHSPAPSIFLLSSYAQKRHIE